VAPHDDRALTHDDRARRGQLDDRHQQFDISTKTDNSGRSRDVSQAVPELDTNWIHPRIELDWIGLCRFVGGIA